MNQKAPPADHLPCGHAGQRVTYDEDEDRARTVRHCAACAKDYGGVFAFRLHPDGDEAWGPVDGAWHWTDLAKGIQPPGREE